MGMACGMRPWSAQATWSSCRGSPCIFSVCYWMKFHESVIMIIWYARSRLLRDGFRNRWRLELLVASTACKCQHFRDLSVQPNNQHACQSMCLSPVPHLICWFMVSRGGQQLKAGQGAVACGAHGVRVQNSVAQLLGN